MSEYKLFVQRIGLIGITNIFVALSSIILLPILTKSFSTSDYGIWVQINTTISLIPYIATLGLPYAMIRFLSSEKNKERISEDFYSILIMILLSSLLISSLIFYFSNNIGSILFNNNVNVVVILSAIIFITCLNLFLLNFFRTFQQMKKYSIFLLIQTYLGLSMVSYLAIKGSSIDMAILGLLIANLITFFIMISIIIINTQFKIPKFKNIKEYLSFGIPTIPGTLSYWIVESSDKYLIGILMSTSFVAYYSPGYILGNIIVLFLGPFAFILPTILPRYYDEKNDQKIKTFLEYSLKYFSLIAIPSVFGISILSKQILMIITTADIALNGYLITPFIAVSAFFYGIYGIISNILLLEKKTKLIGRLWIISAVINIILTVITIPYMGILGAAISTLIAYLFAFILTIIYSQKYFKLSFNLHFMAKSIISSAFLSLILVLTDPKGISEILIMILISIIIYIISLVLLKGFKKDEFKFFKKMILD